MPSPCLAGAVEPGVESGLLNGHRPLVLHLASRCIGGVVGAADRRGRLGERQRCVRRAVGELIDRRLVEVLDGVARLVVTRVVRLPGRSAVDRRLLGRLDARISADGTTGWDACVEERLVVRAAVEGGGLCAEILRGKVVEEDLLDRSRTVWRGGPE